MNSSYTRPIAGSSGIHHLPPPIPHQSYGPPQPPQPPPPILPYPPPFPPPLLLRLNETLMGCSRPCAMFPLRFSTTHFASSWVENSTIAAWTGLPLLGIILLHVTVPY